ncbi:MAG: GNAT family N-acetyltransferase [Devosia sp.]|nr:GNAT family N-acetyltransferase [Devosia sp.]
MALPDALALELAGMKAWPGIDMSKNGSWVLRAANGYTQRANSVQPLDPGDDDDLDTRIAHARDWYAARGLPSIFRMTPLASPRLVLALDAAGWTMVDRSCTLAMDMPDAAPDRRGECLDPFGERFLHCQRTMWGYPEDKMQKFIALMRSVTVPMVGVVLYSDDNVAVATSLWAVADGIAVTGNVVTDTMQRRRGFGGAMMRTGLAWAKGQGATTAALNVVADNAAGRGLYASLGYRWLFDYAYRYPGAA